MHQGMTDQEIQQELAMQDAREHARPAMYRYPADHDMSSDADFTTTCTNPNCREIHPIQQPHKCRDREQLHWEDKQDEHSVWGVVLMALSTILVLAFIGWLVL